MNEPSEINRRAFLKAGLVVGAAFAVGRTSRAEVSKPVRLGIIGVGNRGMGQLRTLLLLPRAEIRAVCDLISERTTRAAQVVSERQGREPAMYSGTEEAWEKLVKREDLDAVVITTPPVWHAPMALAAMRVGKYPAVEVPAAQTLEDCWELVRTSEQTGIPCTMLENVCYFRNVMALLRMVGEGMFGELLHCEAGYQHDCRSLAFTPEGGLTWRGERATQANGNPYPTHAVGPAAQWMNINRGDRFVSLTSASTAAVGLREYAALKFGAEHSLARQRYLQGDLNTTILQTANGRTITLYYNTSSPRPYDLILRLQGTKGIYLGSTDSLSLETADKPAEKWEPFAPYQEKFEHPVWKKLAAEAVKSGGHGGAEYPMFYDFLHAVSQRTAAPQDVYDAAVWSAIVPLSCASVAKGGKLVKFPDFTRGRWQKRAPLAI